METRFVVLVLCALVSSTLGSLLCETDFSAWWHTWVQHDKEVLSSSTKETYSSVMQCTEPGKDGCPENNEVESNSSPRDYAWWRAIGFECEAEERHKCLYSQGHLRKETFECLYPSDWVNDKCGRNGIAELSKVGWPTATYAFATGLFGCTLLWYPEDCGPSTSVGNVCWRYTCSWSYCMIADRLKCNATKVEVPPEWTCAKEKYNAGDECDCNCGIWDPDCMDATRATVGCPNSDDVCIHPGDKCLRRENALARRKELFAAKGIETHHPRYVPTFGRYADMRMSVPVPANWTCPAKYYASNDGCDCNCGAWDPDCNDGTQKVVNCEDFKEFVNQLQMSKSDDKPQLKKWTCIAPRGECFTKDK